jgi:hypothetical protein
MEEFHLTAVTTEDVDSIVVPMELTTQTAVLIMEKANTVVLTELTIQLVHYENERPQGPQLQDRLVRTEESHHIVVPMELTAQTVTLMLKTANTELITPIVS